MVRHTVHRDDNELERGDACLRKVNGNQPEPDLKRLPAKDNRYDNEQAIEWMVGFFRQFVREKLPEYCRNGGR